MRADTDTDLGVGTEKSRPTKKVIPPDDISNEPTDVSTDEPAENSSNTKQEDLDNSEESSDNIVDGDNPSNEIEKAIDLKDLSDEYGNSFNDRTV